MMVPWKMLRACASEALTFGTRSYYASGAIVAVATVAQTARKFGLSYKEPSDLRFVAITTAGAILYGPYSTWMFALVTNDPYRR